VIFAPSGSKDAIIFASGLPVGSFIDVTNGAYWESSKIRPWLYGDYLITKKTAETYESDIKGLLDYWSANRTTLSQHFDVIYENKEYEILQKR
jgi:hypothetical protein